MSPINVDRSIPIITVTDLFCYFDLFSVVVSVTFTSKWCRPVSSIHKVLWYVETVAFNQGSLISKVVEQELFSILEAKVMVRGKYIQANSLRKGELGPSLGHLMGPLNLYDDKPTNCHFSILTLILQNLFVSYRFLVFKSKFTKRIILSDLQFVPLLSFDDYVLVRN